MKSLAGHVVLVLAFADRGDGHFRQGVDLAGVQPHGAGPLHRGQHRVEHFGDDEHFFLGDAEQIVVVRSRLE